MLMLQTSLARLSANDTWERLRAEDDLYAAGATVQPLLTTLLADTEAAFEARWRALFLLGALGGDDAIHALMAARDDDSIDIRQSAVWALGTAGDSRVFELLAGVFADPDEEEQLRFVTASTLALLDRSRALPLLHTALDGAQDAQRRAARAVLANLAEREGASR